MPPVPPRNFYPPEPEHVSRFQIDRRDLEFPALCKLLAASPNKYCAGSKAQQRKQKLELCHIIFKDIKDISAYPEAMNEVLRSLPIRDCESLIKQYRYELGKQFFLDHRNSRAVHAAKLIKGIVPEAFLEIKKDLEWTACKDSNWIGVENNALECPQGDDYTLADAVAYAELFQEFTFARIHLKDRDDWLLYRQKVNFIRLPHLMDEEFFDKKNSFYEFALGQPMRFGATISQYLRPFANIRPLDPQELEEYRINFSGSLHQESEDSTKNNLNERFKELLQEDFSDCLESFDDFNESRNNYENFDEYFSYKSMLQSFADNVKKFTDKRTKVISLFNDLLQNNLKESLEQNREIDPLGLSQLNKFFYFFITSKNLFARLFLENEGLASFSTDLSDAANCGSNISNQARMSLYSRIIKDQNACVIFSYFSDAFYEVMQNSGHHDPIGMQPDPLEHSVLNNKIICPISLFYKIVESFYNQDREKNGMFNSYDYLAKLKTEDVVAPNAQNIESYKSTWLEVIEEFADDQKEDSSQIAAKMAAYKVLQNSLPQIAKHPGLEKVRKQYEVIARNFREKLAEKNPDSIVQPSFMRQVVDAVRQSESCSIQ